MLKTWVVLIIVGLFLLILKKYARPAG